LKPFEITITPRLYETDAMGHINNASIAAWFEVVRVRYMEAVLTEGPGDGKNWILASVHIDFLAETFYGADVTGKIVGGRIGNSSLTLECEMWQGERQTVNGRAVMVFMDYESKAPRRIPDNYRARLEELEAG
jgi:acyl-CoA thioester hydrolase